MSEPTVFTRIINRELPATIFYEDESVIVIKNIHPQAPLHLLGITKHPYASMHQLVTEEERPDLLWHLFKVLARVATEQGVAEKGYRLVTNIGEEGGQSVPHLHVHLLGGTKLAE